MSDEFLKSSGDSKKLLVSRPANYVSVLTEIFVVRFLRRGSSTIDRLQQAARRPQPLQQSEQSEGLQQSEPSEFFRWLPDLSDLSKLPDLPDFQ